MREAVHVLHDELRWRSRGGEHQILTRRAAILSRSHLRLSLSITALRESCLFSKLVNLFSLLNELVREVRLLLVSLRALETRKVGGHLFPVDELVFDHPVDMVASPHVGRLVDRKVWHFKLMLLLRNDCLPWSQARRLAALGCIDFVDSAVERVQVFSLNFLFGRLRVVIVEPGCLRLFFFHIKSLVEVRRCLVPWKLLKTTGYSFVFLLKRTLRYNVLISDLVSVDNLFDIGLGSLEHEILQFEFLHRAFLHFLGVFYLYQLFFFTIGCCLELATAVSSLLRSLD